MIQLMAYDLVQTKRGLRCVNATMIHDFQYPDTYDFGFDIRKDVEGWRKFLRDWRSSTGRRLPDIIADKRYRVWRIGGTPSYEQLFPGKDAQGKQRLVSQEGYITKR